MRIWLPAWAMVLLAGCAGPHSSGSLWALESAQFDTVLSRTPDVVRAEQAHAFELALSDEVLASERARIAAALGDCPSRERQSLELSVGDSVRDSVRIRAADDPERRKNLTDVAVADWRLRRANATGDSGFCDQARAALNGQIQAAEPTGQIEALGEATVSRGGLAPYTGDPLMALSLYAAGAIDTITAKAPLPQYLAAVYGGALDARAPSTQDAASVVDRIAPAYPQWEPDALYAALRSR